MDQTIRTLRGRIDAFGVAEPDIRRQGDDQIQIQLPGVTDTARALQLIGRTAQLTFHRVRYDVSPTSTLMPPGTAWYPLVTGSRSWTAAGKNDLSGGLILDKAPLLSGQDIVDARPAFDERNQPCVSIQFSSRGADQFERVTEELIHQQFAIVLDGVVQSAPVIQQENQRRQGFHHGSFTTEEAQDLAVVLRFRLPARQGLPCSKNAPSAPPSAPIPSARASSPEPWAPSASWWSCRSATALPDSSPTPCWCSPSACSSQGSAFSEPHSPCPASQASCSP